MSDKIKNLLFVCCVIFVFGWVLYLFKSFWTTIAIGFLLAISTSSVHKKILSVIHKNFISALVTTLILCFIFLIPLVYAITQIVIYASNINPGDITGYFNGIKNMDIKLPQQLEFIKPKIDDIIAGIDINAIVKYIFGLVSKFGKSSVNFFIDMFLIVIFYFFSNLYGTKISIMLEKEFSQVNKQIKYIFVEVANTMSVVFYSTISNAILQGILFGIIASIFKYDGLLLGIIFAFSSLIPGIGGALIYIPLSAYTYLNGNPIDAVVILLYSVIVISTIADTFIKPLIIKFINSKLITSPANISELLIFFAMIAGLSTFGFWGVILGPAILTLFVAMLKSFKSFNSL